MNSKSIVIKLVRHGESEANIGKVSPQEFADADVALTKKGLSQATSGEDPDCCARIDHPLFCNAVLAPDG